jgi:hypothetical protein
MPKKVPAGKIQKPGFFLNQLNFIERTTFSKKKEKYFTLHKTLNKNNLATISKKISKKVSTMYCMVLFFIHIFA